MQVVEIYKANAVEARCICQILEDEGIACQLVGEHLESTFGLAAPWNMASILVSENEAHRAREILANRLALRGNDPQPNEIFQFGLRAMFVNFTLIAIILGLYRPLELAWPDFAIPAFYTLLFGNLLAFIYFRKRRRPIDDSKD